MNNFIKQGIFTTVATSLAATSLFLAARPAHAASNTCWMVTAPLKCTTNAVSANPNGNFVHINISPRVKYQVIDSSNGVVVSSGTSGWLGARKTIAGLYGRYQIKAEIAGSFVDSGWATIGNN